MRRYLHTLRQVTAVAVLAGMAASATSARQVSLTILHTTDLHGHILPSTDYEGNENVGGLLRCASLIESIRSEAENVLLVDCGDTIQGGAESYLTDGHLTTRAMEWLKYDAWVLGNHEFDWGLHVLRSVHDKTRLVMLGANIKATSGQVNPLHKVQPFIIRDVDGVRVAFVGLTTPGIPTWTLPDYLGGLLFEESVEALTRVMPEVRAQEPDILVLLLHQGYKPYKDDHANQVREIAARFPEFDVIIGGHTHVVQESVRIGDVLYTQAGYHGNWVGQVDLAYDTVTGRVEDRLARVHSVSDTYPMHPGMREALEPSLRETEEYLAEALGETVSDLTASRLMPAQSPAQQLICKAIAAASKADIVLHGILDDEDVPTGVIRRKDVWRLVPYENRIGVAQLTVSELKEILEENLRHRDGFSFQGVYGLTYDAMPEAPKGERIRNVRLADGTRPHPRKRISVAFNSYVLASGGLKFSRLREVVHRPTSRLEVTDHDTRSEVEKYIREHSPLDIDEGQGIRLQKASHE